MDIGVKNAGFEILACIESDPNCCNTLRANIEKENRKTEVIEQDIRLVDPAKLRNQIKCKEGEIDLLFGGPPCQSFSQIGKQLSILDERGLLLFEITRFAEEFKPKAILIEQVAGLLNAKDHDEVKGGVFEKLIQDLSALNYMSTWKVILTADYGVAQLRKRLFIIATKEKNGFEFPTPTHIPKDMGLFNCPHYMTVGEAINGLGRPLSKNGKTREDSHIDITPDGDRRRIHGVPEGSYLAAQLQLPKEQRGKLTKKDTTKFLRLSRKKPSLTLRCGEIFFHPTTDRYLTPREYMRIHGYPDNYLLKGPIRGRSGRVRDLDQHRQVANSVPPPVAEAIAKNILKVL